MLNLPKIIHLVHDEAIIQSESVCLQSLLSIRGPVTSIDIPHTQASHMMSIYCSQTYNIYIGMPSTYMYSAHIHMRCK